MRYLDGNDSILRWSSEEIIIPYRSPIDGKVHRYFPDFWVKTSQGETLIEIKSKIQTKPPKPKTPAQLVKKLPYLDKWEKYTSINPEEIIRAKMLFTWNTSSKKMTCFESYGGLKVRGSDIIDFDVCTEKTLTDTKLLDRIVTGGNIIAKGFMDEIPRSKTKDGNNRITKNTLLIKVIK
jgi:hypothetical protein